MKKPTKLRVIDKALEQLQNYTNLRQDMGVCCLLRIARLEDSGMYTRIDECPYAKQFSNIFSPNGVAPARPDTYWLHKKFGLIPLSSACLPHSRNKLNNWRLTALCFYRAMVKAGDVK